MGGGLAQKEEEEEEEGGRGKRTEQWGAQTERRN